MTSLLFQHPALLGLLALAGVPLLVHLLSRARPPLYHFPNLDFMRRVLRRTARLRRPQDWLLLALRTLMLAALALVFAGPFVVSKTAALPGTPTTVIVLVDRSASMAARDGAGNRFDSACAAAARYLAAANPSAANLIWIDAEPDAVFPEPGPNLAYLTETLLQSEARPEAGALAAAFDLALRQLAQSHGRRELVVLSDFQASAWESFQPNLPPDVVVRSERIANTTPSNIAVTGVIPQPAEPVIGQDLHVLARVRNCSPDAVRTQVTLDADGARQSHALDLPPWGQAEGAFTLRPAVAGPMAVSVTTEADAFPFDDACHAVVSVRESLELAIEAAADAPALKLLERLAGALPWLEPAKAAAARQPDIRYLDDWDGSGPEALRAAAEAGTTVIIKPGAGCSPAALAKLLGGAIPSPAATYTLESSPAGWSVNPDESHAAVHLFRGGDFGNPFAGTFRERLRLPQELSRLNGAQAVAQYTDGVPAMVEFPTRGASVLLWNVPLDPAKTDWPLQGAFLPAVAEILLRTRPRQQSSIPSRTSGAPLAWTSDDSTRNDSVSLLGPDQTTWRLVESHHGDDTRWQSEQAATPGLYRWQVSGQTIGLAAVNFPESESDLRVLASPPVFGNQLGGTTSLARQAALARGLPLWPWLALAALLFILFESLVHSRTRHTASQPS